MLRSLSLMNLQKYTKFAFSRTNIFSEYCVYISYCISRNWQPGYAASRYMFVNLPLCDVKETEMKSIFFKRHGCQSHYNIIYLLFVRRALWRAIMLSSHSTHNNIHVMCTETELECGNQQRLFDFHTMFPKAVSKSATMSLHAVHYFSLFISS